MNARWPIACLLIAVAAPADAETLVERGRYLVNQVPPPKPPAPR